MPEASRASFLTVSGATRHNLRKAGREKYLGVFTCLTGASGSGKAFYDVLYERSGGEPPRRYKGWEHLIEVVMVDRDPSSTALPACFMLGFF